MNSRDRLEAIIYELYQPVSRPGQPSELNAAGTRPFLLAITITVVKVFVTGPDSGGFAGEWLTVVKLSVCILQVLRLVYCLVKYGYYGSGTSLQQLLEPLMNLLDGKRDLPFPIDTGNYSINV